MDKTKVTFAVVVTLLLSGFLAYSFFSSTYNNEIETTDSDAGSEVVQKDALLFSEQMNEEGPVSVSIQPLMTLHNISDLWEFEIILNTHSVELTIDLRESIVLIDDLGDEYKPVKWEGDPPEGHHREGTLFFDSGDLSSTSITILARGIGGVLERKFMWTITP